MDKKSRQTAKKKLICSFTAVWMALAAAGITTAGFANSSPLRKSVDPCLSAVSYDTADTVDRTTKENECTPDFPELSKNSDNVSVSVSDTDDRRATFDTEKKTTSEKTTSKSNSETASEKTASSPSSETTSEKSASSLNSETVSEKTASSPNSETSSEKTTSSPNSETASEKTASSPSSETTSEKTASKSNSETTSEKTASSPNSETTSEKSASRLSSETTSEKTASKSNSETTSEKSASSLSSETTSEKTASSPNSETASEKTASSPSSETASEKTASSPSSETTSEKTTSSPSSEKTSEKKPKKDDKKESEKSATRQPPKKYLIDVAHINQNNNLVTGCEIVSAKMVLDYYGKKDITFDNMLKHTEMWNLKITKDGKLYGKTPYEAFIGNPKVYSGFGCFPPVIENMIDDFEFDDLYTEDTCGLPLDFLAKTYVTQDTPVLVWATIGMSESYPTCTWYGVGHKGEPNDKKYTWRAGEHCLVLVGYDDKYYSFADPLSYQKVTKYEKKLVEKRYKEIGMQSMLIRKKEAE